MMCTSNLGKQLQEMAVQQRSYRRRQNAETSCERWRDGTESETGSEAESYEAVGGSCAHEDAGTSDVRDPASTKPLRDSCPITGSPTEHGARACDAETALRGVSEP